MAKDKISEVYRISINLEISVFHKVLLIYQKINALIKFVKTNINNNSTNVYNLIANLGLTYMNYLRFQFSEHLHFSKRSYGSC